MALIKVFHVPAACWLDLDQFAPDDNPVGFSFSSRSAGYQRQQALARNVINPLDLALVDPGLLDDLVAVDLFAVGQVDFLAWLGPA